MLADATAAAVLASVAPPSVLAEAAAAAVLAEAALPPVLADAATTAVLALGAHPPVLADAAAAGPPQSLQYRIFATPAPIFACLSNALPISLSKSMPLALISPPPDLYYMPLPRAPAELASKRFIVFFVDS